MVLNKIFKYYKKKEMLYIFMDKAYITEIVVMVIGIKNMSAIKIKCLCRRKRNNEDNSHEARRNEQEIKTKKKSKG